MTKFGEGLSVSQGKNDQATGGGAKNEDNYISIEQGAIQLFENSFVNKTNKPDWNDIDQLTKDVWIRKAALETILDQPKLYQSVCLSAYMSGESLHLIDWYELLKPAEGENYIITKVDIKLMIGTQENATR